MLALGIRYLTGYAVATDVSSRERAEWPPHPARVFMAMAATFFETGEDPDERAALEWLEGLGSPALWASDAAPRTVVTHFVPVNDNAKPVKKNKALTPLQSAGVGRDRQPRTFPRVRPYDENVYLLWPEAELPERQKPSLERLCSKVTRIGHSSSLVQMWVEDTPPTEDYWEPADFGEMRLRAFGEGTLGYLEEMANAKGPERHAELVAAIQSAKAEKKAVKGEGSKERKTAIQERINGLQSELEQLDPRPAIPPKISLWQAYRKVGAPASPPCPAGAFERELLVLTLWEGPVIGLESTWQLLTVLHKTVLSLCDPAPEWLSGHQADQSASQHPHVALMPLAFVGREHADGHLMGVALAMPKGIPPRERAQALRPLLFDQNGRPKPLEMRAGSLGSWTLARDTRTIPALTLQRRTWTGPCDTWATVTPIVLDRHPKASRARNRERWSIEVAEIIAESCTRQGLPRPVAVDVDKTSWHRGAPRAVAGKGAGYPLMPVKNGSNNRQQVHAWLRFDREVEGPLLLGAGRYRGYGVCRPWKGGPNVQHRT